MKTPGEVIKLNEGIYAVRGTWMRHISLLSTWAFIIRNDNNHGMLVVDTCGSGSGKIISDAIRKAGMNPADITGIAITQWHGDHTGGLAELVSHVSAAGGEPVKIFIHKADAAILQKQRGEFIKIHPFLKFPVYHKPGKIPSANQFEIIRLSDSLDENPLEAWGVDFIHTPGHTPGHTSFFHRKSMTLFSGSALSFLGDDTVGIVPVFDDRNAQIKSAHKLMEMDFRFLCPAHMKLKKEEVAPDNRFPFMGRVPFLYCLFGLLPIFRYKSHL